MKLDVYIYIHVLYVRLDTLINRDDCEIITIARVAN